MKIITKIIFLCTLLLLANSVTFAKFSDEALVKYAKDNDLKITYLETTNVYGEKVKGTPYIRLAKGKTGKYGLWGDANAGYEILAFNANGTVASFMSVYCSSDFLISPEALNVITTDVSPYMIFLNNKDSKLQIATGGGHLYKYSVFTQRLKDPDIEKLKKCEALSVSGRSLNNGSLEYCTVIKKEHKDEIKKIITAMKHLDTLKAME